MDDAQGIHITEIVNAFRDLGHEVKVFSLVQRDEESGKKNKGQQWETVTRIVPNFVYELMEILYNLYAYFKLTALIKNFKPDFIYERYAMYNFCGVLASRRKKIPIILEVNAPLSYEQSKYEELTFKKLAKRIENWICNHATKVIVVSSALKDILIKQGVGEYNIHVLSNGINPKEFDRNRKFRPIRSKYNIPTNALVIGIVGWFREWHGLNFLIASCLEHDLFKLHNVYLLLIGDGPIIPETRKLVEVEKISEYIKFTGSIERGKIADYLAALDIAIQPRVTDYASPMKILEYMAMGKAIIAPDKQNIRDIMIDQENALLFEPENKKDLFKKILLLIKDKNLRRKISENAYNTISKMKLYWHENAKRSIGIIQNIFK